MWLRVSEWVSESKWREWKEESLLKLTSFLKRYWVNVWDCVVFYADIELSIVLSVNTIHYCLLSWWTKIN